MKINLIPKNQTILLIVCFIQFLRVAAANADVSETWAFEKAEKILKISTGDSVSKFKLSEKSKQFWGKPIELLGPPDAPWQQVISDPEWLCYSFRFRHDNTTEVVRIDIRVKTGNLVDFTWSRSKVTGNKKVSILSLVESLEKAKTWLRNVGEAIQPDLSLYRSEESRTGTFSFEWRKRIINKGTTIVLNFLLAT